jgi:hypothetical protein
VVLPYLWYKHRLGLEAFLSHVPYHPPLRNIRPAMFKTKGKAALTQTGDVALALLKLVAASSGWNPPLKAATDGALHIIELIKVCIHIHFFFVPNLVRSSIYLGLSISPGRLEELQ